MYARSTRDTTTSTTHMHEIKSKGLDAAASDQMVSTHLLTHYHEAEALRFLSERPLHTFGLTGLIKDNGLRSPINRGRFYACRDRTGSLQGIGLVGYNTLFEARTDQAVRAFADLSRGYPGTFLILGEEAGIRTFWESYRPTDFHDAKMDRYVLFTRMRPVNVRRPVENLRRASLADLDSVVIAHNKIGIEETGVDGLRRDREGFSKRCADRIQRGRTWVLNEKGKLIFKVEVMTQTPEVTYIESMWVNPEERSKGYGFRCLGQLSKNLLEHTGCVCLLVNESNKAAQALYKKAGFEVTGNYLAVFLNTSKNNDVN